MQKLEGPAHKSLHTVRFYPRVNFKQGGKMLRVLEKSCRLQRDDWVGARTPGE